MVDKSDEPLDNQIKPQLENLSGEVISNNEANTVIPKNETETMEVHHHPQVEKKNLKEYMLEGLMIFLAVTLGFFAENIREHLGDRAKEKEYIQNINQDLLADITNLNIWIPGLFQKINEFDTLISLLERPENKSGLNDMYLYARLSTRTRTFDASNNTITELKNSGNFRLIVNEKAVRGLADFQKNIQNYLTINAIDIKEAELLYPLIGNIFDASVFNKMITVDTSKTNSFQIDSSGNLSFNNIIKPNNNPSLRNTDKDLINLLIFYLHQRKASFIGEVRLLRMQKRKATELIELLNKEYGLSN